MLVARNSVGAEVAVVVKPFLERRAYSQLSAERALDSLAEHVRRRVEEHCRATTLFVLRKNASRSRANITIIISCARSAAQEPQPHRHEHTHVATCTPG